MRCLTLADALRQQGAECGFVTRDLQGHLAERIASRGFACHLLPVPRDGEQPHSPPAHACWAEVPWQQDAAETRAALSVGPPPDWLVLDHYAFDRRWEEAVLPPSCKLMVIDDLADRPHMADLLLDQNLGRDASDYDELLPDTAVRLIGPRYALLRPEFAELRAPTLIARAERAAKGVKHLLISLGGVDLQNATAAILRTLPSCSLPADAHVTIVMGRNAPGLSEVRQLAAALPWSHEVLVDVTDMARLMAQADLAIGAGGGTSWERCCMGLPSIIIATADNQAVTVVAMQASSAALGTGPLSDSAFGHHLAVAVSKASQTLTGLSQCAARICDGAGAQRVAAECWRGRLRVRKAQMSDAEAIWRWRNHDDASAFYIDPNPKPLSDHLVWFANALTSPSCNLLIIEYDSLPAAHIRIDTSPDCPGEIEISIYLNPHFRGKRMAKRFLLAAINSREISSDTVFVAKAHVKNYASVHLFLSAGFVQVSQSGQFALLRRMTRAQDAPTFNQAMHT
jgi:UDP-2,4-diacetamido-2,4,6-trideoxy-beta-L-altropyranose hydrolase